MTVSTVGDDVEQRPRCGAHAKQTSAPCGQAPGWGTDHPGFGRCKLHGGNTPSGRQAAHREMASHAAVTLGLPIEIDPAQALLDELYRTAGHVHWLRDQLEELDPKALTMGATSMTEIRGQVSGSARPNRDGETTRVVGAGVNVLWRVYMEEREHLRKVSETCLRIGIERRKLELAENQGVLAGQALRKILDGLGLTIEQRALVPALVRVHLAALTR